MTPLLLPTSFWFTIVPFHPSIRPSKSCLSCPAFIWIQPSVTPLNFQWVLYPSILLYTLLSSSISCYLPCEFFHCPFDPSIILHTHVPSLYIFIALLSAIYIPSDHSLSPWYSSNNHLVNPSNSSFILYTLLSPLWPLHLLFTLFHPFISFNHPFKTLLWPLSSLYTLLPSFCTILASLSSPLNPFDPTISRLSHMALYHPFSPLTTLLTSFHPSFSPYTL